MTISEASRRGAANRRKGARAEAELARYLRQWWPQARRAREEAWRSGGHSNGDRGDIAGLGAVVLQVKHVDRFGDADLAEARADTQAQTAEAGADYGFLIQRRAGKTDPASWYAWIELVDLVGLLDGPNAAMRYTGLESVCRFAVTDLVCLLLDAGYGSREGSL